MMKETIAIHSSNVLTPYFENTTPPALRATSPFRGGFWLAPLLMAPLKGELSPLGD